ncbi:DUF2063 domain-containing protein [Candidatus Methylospira mobilis]|uniref:DUF2063 domain-containing protein n=1 Tax=Candidatus Methylospira mobilis TaxID=1808979 RepID=A0A5Q0BHG2_9GAMM|nr:putative DNA-binding domain-containing protein [Candidatus Methylospira mobilis]QFY42562.1 DUF2063 domain-containing protein [Candidatus Methylospira mobilis]WNV04320.1 putative DNA-binding domain-containing protein [Candidatus Methylospira mobilis]
MQPSETGTPAFIETQRAFSAYIRDPHNNPMPADVQPQRIAMYRELLSNNIDSFLSNAFPIIKETLDSRYWQTLIDDFFARHRSSSPYFSGVPEEFLDYLAKERADMPGDPPFLLELAHYEWVEMALAIAEEEAPEPDADKLEKPLDTCIRLSPVAWPLAYRFPVHRIACDNQPLQAPADPTYLAVYRNREDEVLFLELNNLTYRLLQRLSENHNETARAILGNLALEMGYTDINPILKHGATLLTDLAERGIV